MKNIICKIFGHKYRLHRIITYSVRELKCKRCAEMFGMNDGTKSVIPMDWELAQLHKEIKTEL